MPIQKMQGMPLNLNTQNKIKDPKKNNLSFFFIQSSFLFIKKLFHISQAKLILFLLLFQKTLKISNKSYSLRWQLIPD